MSYAENDSPSDKCRKEGRFVFNCISTFMGYLIPKIFLEKNNIGTIYPTASEIREFILFSVLVKVNG